MPPMRDMGGGGAGGGAGVATVGVGMVAGRPKTPARMDLHEEERVRLAAAAAAGAPAVIGGGGGVGGGGGAAVGGLGAGGAVQAPVTPRVVERPSTPLAGQRPASPLLRADGGALERPKTPTCRQEAEGGAHEGGGAAAWPEGAAEGQVMSGTPRLRAERGGERPTTPTRRGEVAVVPRGEGRVGRLERPTTPLHGADGGLAPAFATRAAERLDVEAERLGAAERLNVEGDRLNVDAERLGAAARKHTAVPRGVGGAAQGQAGSRADRASFRGKVRPKSFVERNTGDGGGSGRGEGAWPGVGAVPRPTTPVRRGDGSLERAVAPGGRVGAIGGSGDVGGGGRGGLEGNRE
ncbi:unnamed protein product [Closterium sp. Yama58-4]|nr:unnamed protein product [Closterium sp. Yama58-4]